MVVSKEIIIQTKFFSIPQNSALLTPEGFKKHLRVELNCISSLSSDTAFYHFLAAVFLLFCLFLRICILQE
jgi:hypothetical protein